jgi:hypothetical protein
VLGTASSPVSFVRGQPVKRPPALIVSVPWPRDRQDELVVSTIGPLVRTLRASPAAGAVWFLRVGKPDWAIEVLVTGEPAWVQGTARACLAAELGVARGAAAFLEDVLEDKWTGGSVERATLAPFHDHDTHACIEALGADARGALGSRARFSLLVVEGILDRLGLHGEQRQLVYRRSFDWTLSNGRWDAEVIESLEGSYLRQREWLAAAMDAPPERGSHWPSPRAEQIGRSLLETLRRDSSASPMDPLDRATFATRAHSNRLGLHGSREAALRYLAWRARGGAPSFAP